MLIEYSAGMLSDKQHLNPQKQADRLNHGHPFHFSKKTGICRAILNSTRTPQMTLLVQGFRIVPECLSRVAVAKFIQLSEGARESDVSESAVSHSTGVYALRNLVEIVPETVEIIRCPAGRNIVDQILGPGAFLVRSALFDNLRANSPTRTALIMTASCLSIGSRILLSLSLTHLCKRQLVSIPVATR